MSTVNKTALPAFAEKISYYFQLTKPTIMLLVIITGATALFMEGSLIHKPLDFLLVLVALYLTGGSANALNQYFERDIDALMERTKNKRPLPLKRIKSGHALIYAISIGIIGILMFGLIFNWLTAFLSLATILFYSLFYTLWLKPHSIHNIVIGGIAGAMAPVGAWTAATGKVALAPWILFLIIFLWTPPHFWALASFRTEDYKKSGLPMLPVVKGIEFTMKQIFIYAIILVIATLSLFWIQAGWFYLGVAIIMGVVFIKKTYQAKRDQSVNRFRGLFGYSIIYLFALCLSIIVERLVILWVTV
jgi:protoheme IX farnesyltransferase